MTYPVCGAAISRGGVRIGIVVGTGIGNHKNPNERCMELTHLDSDADADPEGIFELPGCAGQVTEAVSKLPFGNTTAAGDC